MASSSPDGGTAPENTSSTAVMHWRGFHAGQGGQPARDRKEPPEMGAQPNEPAARTDRNISLLDSGRGGGRIRRTFSAPCHHLREP